MMRTVWLHGGEGVPQSAQYPKCRDFSWASVYQDSGRARSVGLTGLGIRHRYLDWLTDLPLDLCTLLTYCVGLGKSSPQSQP